MDRKNVEARKCIICGKIECNSPECMRTTHGPMTVEKFVTDWHSVDYTEKAKIRLVQDFIGMKEFFLCRFKNAEDAAECFKESTLKSGSEDGDKINIYYKARVEEGNENELLELFKKLWLAEPGLRYKERIRVKRETLQYEINKLTDKLAGLEDILEEIKEYEEDEEA